MLYKLKTTNEQRKTNKQKLVDKANNMVVLRSKGVLGEIKSKGGQIYSDRRWFDFG